MSELPTTPSAPAARKRAAAKTATGRRRAGVGPRHDDKRTAILRTAAQLFADNGYEATSLDMIADRLGMHKATLYHYVDNKESILYQCLVLSFADLDVVMKAVEDRTVPVLDRLRMFVRSLAQAQNTDFGRCLLLVGARPLDLSTGTDIRQFQRRLDQTVRDLITEGIASGAFRPCQPALFSALLFGALNWVPRWHKDGDKLTTDEIADAYMDMLIQGIGAGRR